MRSLAERLGVKAASLYWHLRDKEELGDLLIEAINSELPDPPAGLRWRDRLEQLAWAWRQVLLQHRDAARLAMGRFVTRPVTLRRIELVLATLREAGFAPSDIANAAYLISNFVPGFVAEETAPRPAREDRSLVPSQTAAPPLEQARLEIGWAKRLTIRADPTIPDLYMAHGDGQPPEVYASNGVVNLTQTRGRKSTVMVLNATIPWDIQLRQGAAHLVADLRGLQLRAFDVDGGISVLDLTLPLPSGTIPVRMRGGTSKLTIHRPSEVPTRIDIRGGISKLTFDHQPFKSAGELTVQTPGYDRATDRYDVSLTGGTSKLVIDTSMPPESGPAAAGPETDMPRSMADLPPSQYPNLVAIAKDLTNPSMDDRFRFGLKVLLDGLERRLPSAPRGA